MKTPVPSAWGVFAATWTARGLAALRWPGMMDDAPPCRVPAPFEDWTKRLAAELDIYFAGDRGGFSLQLDWAGHTAFRRRVWQALCIIPHGETRTYGDIAARIGCRGARAVGQACGANPVPVLVPCHRVVAAGGLGGFGSGLARKRRLLALEGSLQPSWAEREEEPA